MKANKLKIKVLLITAIISFCLAAFSISNAAATTERYAWNYDDTIPENALGVWYDSPTNYENLAVTYNMGEGVCIIKGIGYGYGSNTISSMKIRFVGDSFWVQYVDEGIPAAPAGLTRSFWCAGPTYLLDDDPSVELRGNETSAFALAIGADTPSYGHSWYEHPLSGGWTLDLGYEYFVDLFYEWVVTLPIDTIDTGSLTSIDNLDAYFITLTNGNDYQFDLARTSGTGDLDMRIVTYQDLTNDNLVVSSGSTYPKSMNYVPSYTGTYVLLVEADTFGEVADYSINYFLDEQPVADFTANATSIITNQDIEFTYTGTEGNTPTTYEWDFGDLSPVSNDQNPIHTYTSAGTYTVSVLVTDDDSDSDTETKIDYITVAPDTVPNADFTANATSIIEGQDVEFTYTGSGGNPPVSYNWNFGDGSPFSNDQNPIHTYATASTYTVSVLVVDDDGDPDMETKIDYITVAPDTVPIVDFTANTTTPLQHRDVQFTYTGTDGNPPLSYEWDFGDLSPVSNDQHPIHSYSTASTYTVSLTVTDYNSDSDTETKIDYITVTPNLLPSADFTANATTIIANQDIEFTYTGTEGDPPATYEWNFGDGSPVSNDQHPIHTYATDGIYTVSVKVTDNNGDSDTETKTDYITVEVDLFPSAFFTQNATIIIANQDIQFTYTGTEGNPPATYEWDFGDLTAVSNDQNPIHTYATAGTYTVSVLVTDTDGDPDTETKIDYITVNPNIIPSADFTANDTDVLIGEDILFTFTGDLGNTPTNCEWDFGDGSPICIDQNPVYNYTTAGNYTVTLTITDDNSETDTMIKIGYIVVTAPPTPPPNGNGDGGDRDLWEEEEITLPLIFIGVSAIAAAGVVIFIMKRRHSRLG